MSSQVIAARIRGFICLNAHPAGCAANVDAEIAVVEEGAGAGAGSGLGAALVIGGSTGYGLSSLLSAVFGYGAQGTAVCLERPPQGEKTASAGWSPSGWRLGAPSFVSRSPRSPPDAMSHYSRSTVTKWD